MHLKHRHVITATIGPSGCGKSTLIRCFNRMNDLIPGFRAEGELLFEGRNICARGIDPVDVRRRVGMVFQKPNPFPKSVHENVAFGAQVNGHLGKLQRNALTLSGGQHRSGQAEEPLEPC